MKYSVRSVFIPNSKGLKLDTEIYRPDVTDRLPVVLLLHGFTGYKEDAGLVDIAKRLAEQGIISVRFTTSGFGDSEGTLEKDYRFSNYRTDADAVYEYISKLSYVDMNRLGVYGHSMGGKLAVLLSYDHADIKALCIASAPVEFSGTRYGEIEDEWKKKRYFEKISGRDGKTTRVPYEYRVDADLPRHDVLEAARFVANPHALVIAGKCDDEVPWRETEKIYQALHCPKEWVLLEGVGHQYKRDKKLLRVVHDPIVRFFNTYL